MGKIGEYRYPEIGPEEATSIIHTVKNNIGDTVEKNDREKLANLLGHEDAESGAFKQKLAALKQYNLLEGRGTLGTTELADRAVDGESSVYKEMLNHVHLLNRAFNYFDGEPVGRPEWESYLEQHTRIGEGVDDIPAANKIRNIYLEFVRLIPEDSPGEDSEDVLDKEREFDYYVKKLDNDKTREPALDALTSKLKEKRLPDADPLDTLLEFIREAKYPDHQSDFFYLLRVICEKNDLDHLNRREEVVKLLYDRMEKYSEHHNVANNQRSLSYILDTLQVLHPEDLVSQWWDLYMDRLREGAELPNEDMRKFAKSQLADRLMRGRDEFTQEFYEEFADDAEDKLWTTMAEAEEERLREDCKWTLNTMGVF